MKARIPYRVQGERGVVLMVSLLVLVILSLLGLAFLGTALTENNIATNFRDQTQAFYAAEAGLESGIVDLRNLLAGTPTPTDAQLTALAPRPLSDPSLSQNLTFTTFQVQRVRTTPPYSYQTVISSGPYAGLSAFTTDYRITAEVTGPRGSRARLTQIVQQMEVPLFQFGIFYGKGVDLEFSPGPTMTVTGRVHANSNIYVRDALSEAGFRFDSFMTTAGNIYRGVKRDSNRYMNPQVKDANGVYQTLNFDHVSQDLDSNNSWDPWSVNDWKTKALERFGGKVQDSAHGVQEITPPIPGLFLIDPNDPNAPKPDVVAHKLIEKGDASDSPEMKAAKMYYKADLIIEDGSANKTLPPGVITTKTFWDDRERKTMTVTEVDIGALVDSGQAPKNGILYVYRSGGGGNKGVRLVNGEELPGPTKDNPNGGLTVVSENPVYIQGDYNTENKQPAAVLADAITVLSNNWGPNKSDTKGDKKKTDRPASDTEVNAAFALGPSHETVPGAGNGWMNNVIRFLEAWGTNDAKFTYRGSVVSLWHSQQVTAPFREPGSLGAYYGPPERDWGYDTLFNTKLPPGTPMATLPLVRGRWSQE